VTTSDQKSRLTALTLAAIGIVYGDIGTSPLYTMKEVFAKEHRLVLNEPNIIGVVSLILWGLIIIISIWTPPVCQGIFVGCKTGEAAVLYPAL
jgi:KUP system potassium uptake protein